MTDAEQRWLLRVKSLPCVICVFKLGITRNGSGGEAHHCGEHRDHFFVAALCNVHHRGATGVHGLHRAAFYRLWKVDDQKLVAWTLRLHLEDSDESATAF